MIVLDPEKLNRLFVCSGEFFLEEKYRYINTYLQERTQWVVARFAKEENLNLNDEKILKNLNDKILAFVKKKYEHIKRLN